MPIQKEYIVSLVFTRELVDTLHFKSYVKDQWLVRSTNNDTSNNISFCPIHLDIKTLTIINKRDFITNPDYNEFQFKYICQFENLYNNIYKNSS